MSAEHNTIATQAVFLKFISKRTLNESPKFRINCSEFKFLLTGSIHSSEWPLVFSEYIVDTITENTPSNTSIGVTIKHGNVSGNIPFMPLANLTPTVFDDHFENIFCNVAKLSGILCLEVSLVLIPCCYLR